MVQERAGAGFACAWTRKHSSEGGSQAFQKQATLSTPAYAGASSSANSHSRVLEADGE